MLEYILDYSGKVRFASLIHLDYVEVDGESLAGWYPRDYELVTQSFVDSLGSRIEKQRPRVAGYTNEMRERFSRAELLLRSLIDDQTDQ